MFPVRISILPEGTERTLTRQEVSDLLEFLYNQRCGCRAAKKDRNHTVVVPVRRETCKLRRVDLNH